MIWPDGKKFAFTVFDDTDGGTIDNTEKVYSFFRSVGIRTTKSVWPLSGKTPVADAGSTCAEEVYLKWLLELQRSGFEISFHNAAPTSSLRAETIAGLDRFRELFGKDPVSMANHANCEENIYWGPRRLSGVYRGIYNLLTRGKNSSFFRGDKAGDPYFWGDICRDRIKYVRNFVYPEINTLKVCPFMPYRDEARPYVNYWFASANGGNVVDFNECINERAQDRLEAEGGACIMYTHFANGFQSGTELEPKFKSLMERLAAKDGWFVPVSTLLDYLRGKNGEHIISGAERASMERRWLWWKIFKGSN